MSDPRLERWKGNARLAILYLRDDGKLVVHDAYVTGHGTTCYGYGNTILFHPMVDTQSLPYGDGHPDRATLKIPCNFDLPEPMLATDTPAERWKEMYFKTLGELEALQDEHKAAKKHFVKATHERDQALTHATNCQARLELVAKSKAAITRLNDFSYLDERQARTSADFGNGKPPKKNAVANLRKIHANRKAELKKALAIQARHKKLHAENPPSPALKAAIADIRSKRPLKKVKRMKRKGAR